MTILTTPDDGAFLVENRDLVRRRVVDVIRSDIVREHFEEALRSLQHRSPTRRALHFLAETSLGRRAAASWRESPDATLEALLPTYLPFAFAIHTAGYGPGSLAAELRNAVSEAITAGTFDVSDIPLVVAIWARSMFPGRGVPHSVLGQLRKGCVVADWFGHALYVVAPKPGSPVALYDVRTDDDRARTTRRSGSPTALFRVIDARGRPSGSQVRVRVSVTRKATVVLADPYEIPHLVLEWKRKGEIQVLETGDILRQVAPQHLILMLDGTRMSETEIEGYCMCPPTAVDGLRTIRFLLVSDRIPDSFVDEMNRPDIPPLLVKPRGIGAEMPVGNEKWTRFDKVRNGVVCEAWGPHAARPYGANERWVLATALLPPHRPGATELFSRRGER